MKNSIIHKTASIGNNSKIINSILHENVSIGTHNLCAYSEIDAYSYTGEFSHLTSCKIGKFCSLSWNVSIGAGFHDYKKITTHPLLAVKKLGFVKESNYSQYPDYCNIGNDVWIGCNCTILRKVNIGNGAIIGSNSVVTKDIPPYSIAVGAPAKIIKYRFSPEVINELLNLEWWNIKPKIIKDNINLFEVEPTIEIINKIKLLK